MLRQTLTKPSPLPRIGEILSVTVYFGLHLQLPQPDPQIILILGTFVTLVFLYSLLIGFKDDVLWFIIIITRRNKS